MRAPSRRLTRRYLASAFSRLAGALTAGCGVTERNVVRPTRGADMKRSFLAVAGGMFAAFALAGAAHAQGSGSPTIDTIKSRGQLACGVEGKTAGFSLAAILGDATKVKFVNTTSQNRFTALQSGEIDVLIRETTWTLGREGNLGLEF